MARGLTPSFILPVSIVPHFISTAEFPVSFFHSLAPYINSITVPSLKVTAQNEDDPNESNAAYPSDLKSATQST